MDSGEVEPQAPFDDELGVGEDLCDFVSLSRVGPMGQAVLQGVSCALLHQGSSMPHSRLPEASDNASNRPLTDGSRSGERSQDGRTRRTDVVRASRPRFEQVGGQGQDLLGYLRSPHAQILELLGAERLTGDGEQAEDFPEIGLLDTEAPRLGLGTREDPINSLLGRQQPGVHRTAEFFGFRVIREELPQPVHVLAHGEEHWRPMLADDRLDEFLCESQAMAVILPSQVGVDVVAVPAGRLISPRLAPLPLRHVLPRTEPGELVARRDDA